MKRGKLKRLAQVKNCDHKFIDSKACLKCGFIPKPCAEPAVPVAKRVPFSFSVTEHAVTRLRRGYVIRYDGLEHVVTKVNQSCARIAPLHTAGTETVKFTPRFAEKPVSFSVPIKHNVVSISANSEGEILRKLSPEQMESRGFK